MLYFINTISTDPKFNLALEEVLFDSFSFDEDLLILWQNDKAVILGKNQIVENEVSSLVYEDKIPIVRRNSGGGAVYHDLGNLNFSFISKNDKRDFPQIILKTLRSLGIPAQLNGRNDITLYDKKISGISQYAKGHKNLLHGTLLFSSNLDNMDKYLKPETKKLEKHGVQSVRTRVGNISELVSSKITIDQFKDRLLKTVKLEEPLNELHLDQQILQKAEDLYKRKYNNIDWNINKKINYKKSRLKTNSCGNISIVYILKNNILEDITFFGDYLFKKDINELKEEFIGKSLEYVKEFIEDLSLDEYFLDESKNDILELLRGLDEFKYNQGNFE